ncbi:MAG: aminoglycoside phosphotransferase family protein [Myxococcales bacterium]|nr:aminoglycoside phosphotransferase family protein [Myxococcales bacterium]
MTPSADAAIAEVRALAAELGVPAEPVVVADRSNLVLLLDVPGEPLIARVAMATSLVRVGLPWLRREIELTHFLAQRGGAVTQPAARVDPGPYERGGLVISFWLAERLVAELADPVSAGTTLAALHAQLADYPMDRLPLWGGFDEGRQAFARAKQGTAFAPDELRKLERAFEQAERIIESARARTASFQALHGDAHIRNVLATERGTLWTDWEDAFVGPVEWDIASLRSRAELFGEDLEHIEATCRAYSGPWDRTLARELGLVRNVQIIPWLAAFAERQPELLPRMRKRIERLP